MFWKKSDIFSKIVTFMILNGCFQPCSKGLLVHGWLLNQLGKVLITIMVICPHPHFASRAQKFNGVLTSFFPW